MRHFLIFVAFLLCVDALVIGLGLAYWGIPSHLWSM